MCRGTVPQNSENELWYETSWSTYPVDLGDDSKDISYTEVTEISGAAEKLKLHTKWATNQ